MERSECCEGCCGTTGCCGAAAAGGAYDPPAPSDVEPDVEDVAVLDNVGLGLEPLRAGSRGLPVATRSDEGGPTHDLAADEASGDVRVDCLRSVERGLAAPQRPRSRLLVARGEERDQIERL